MKTLCRKLRMKEMMKDRYRHKGEKTERESHKEHICPFIHSFIKYLFGNYYSMGTTQ